MTKLDLLRVSQERFASSRELAIDAGGYLECPSDNLVQPLAEEMLAEIERVASWRSCGPKPGELQRVDSKLPLLCNVFAPFSGHAQPLGTVLEISDVERIRLAPDEREGTDPAPDLLIETAKRPCAIVASYAEPFRGVRASTPSPHALAEQLTDLPGCRNLALDMAAAPGRYARLDVALLLSAASWLETRYGQRGYRLLHLYFDAADRATAELRREIDRFRIRTGGEIDFQARSWTSVFDAMGRHAPELESTRSYLVDRYALGDAESACPSLCQ